MKKRRSRWVPVAAVAVALVTASWSVPSGTPLTMASHAAPVSGHNAASVPATNTSWQTLLMSGRW